MQPLNWPGWSPFSFPTHLGDLAWLSYRTGAQLMEGMKCSKDSTAGHSFLYFYPEPEELRERLAALEREPEPLVALEREGTIRAGSLEELKRFVALYELAFAERTEWEQVMENVDLADHHLRDETKDDDAIVEPQENVTELLGQEVQWGDPTLMASKFRPVPGEFHREPTIILHP